MKIFYLNCFRRLNDFSTNPTPQREWLQKYVQSKDIDLLCLSESSNYNMSECLPKEYPHSYLWEQPTLGFGFNICSKDKINYEFISFRNNKSIEANYNADLHNKRIVSLKVWDINMVAAHIPHEPRLRVIALEVLRDYMERNKPKIVFGDFNCGYNNDFLSYFKDPENNRKLFIKEEALFNEFEAMGYANIKRDEGEYTYRHTVEPFELFRIDHAFALGENVSMDYIDTLKVGFNHKGMLIEIVN